MSVEKASQFAEMEPGFRRVFRHVVLGVRHALEHDEIGGDARFP